MAHGSQGNTAAIVGVTIAYGWNTAHVGGTLLVRDVTCGVGVKGTLDGWGGGGGGGGYGRIDEGNREAGAVWGGRGGGA